MTRNKYEELDPGKYEVLIASYKYEELIAINK